ncbi:hypothetical protein [Sphingobacterium sp. SYP-B4668]|uniref:hypothetical protein n=1 Tax=Sphingobacterium sp. SYP-B4668 TaxID=2996035 RepID=UPI0022DD4481|nr:hypothetical protein [Sphingobacterium sp. SYP-B4668]
MMKNKIRFIVPKLIGATLIVGLLSLVIGLLFKLLVVGTFLASAGFFIASRMRKKRRPKMLKEYNSSIAPQVRDSSFGIKPQNIGVQYSTLAIIPIH